MDYLTENFKIYHTFGTYIALYSGNVMTSFFDLQSLEVMGIVQEVLCLIWNADEFEVCHILGLPMQKYRFQNLTPFDLLFTGSTSKAELDDVLGSNDHR